MRAKILGIPVDKVDLKGALARVAGFIREGKPHHVITLNAEILCRALEDRSLKRIIEEAHLVTPDGAGVVWASHRLGDPLPERVTGIDLLLKISRAAARSGWSLYFYGGKPGVAELAARRLRESWPELRVAGTSHGYLSRQEEEAMLARIREGRPDVLFVALGAPRQEYWISDHLRDLQVPVCMGVGGSLDVISGTVRRAPRLWREMRLEWLYLLLRQPQRAGRMLALPRFALAVLRESRKKADRKE